MPASGLSMNAHTGTHTQQINYKWEEKMSEGKREGSKEGRREAEKKGGERKRKIF